MVRDSVKYLQGGDGCIGALKSLRVENQHADHIHRYWEVTPTTVVAIF